MKTIHFLLIPLFICLLITGSSNIRYASSCFNNKFTSGNGDEKIKDCSYKGFKLYGKIKIVTNFPDIKVKVVENFPDIKVKVVQNFPDECGKWQIVDNFPDVKVEFVESFPDIKVQFVENFPGMP